MTGLGWNIYQGELEKFRTNAPGAHWVNWIGDGDCGPDVTIARPRGIDDLQGIVRKHKAVRAGATGHSFNPFTCPADAKGSPTPGVIVHMMHFRELQIKNLGDGRYGATIGAGMKMGSAQNVLLQRGLTLRVPPGNSAYTVGGCIATGCHNLGQSHAQDLLALNIMTSDGTVRHVKRGDADFMAAAVSIGRLGIILNVTLEVLPYRQLQWKADQVPLQKTPEVIETLEGMTKMQTSQETLGNKLVFYMQSEVQMVEHWVPVPEGRAMPVADGVEQGLGHTHFKVESYQNKQPFRVGQGPLTRAYASAREVFFRTMPPIILDQLQLLSETAFRGIHSSPILKRVRKTLGWQHSPESRGEGAEATNPKGLQYSWAGWIDEFFNLAMGLRHVEVIFPVEPRARAIKCLDIVFAHKHLAWWRLNIRTQRSENFYISPTFTPEGSKPIYFARVDFVSPGAQMDLPNGEASLTEQLHKDCPGWRKHWGKGLFGSSAEEQWGDAEAFKEVAAAGIQPGSSSLATCQAGLSEAGIPSYVGGRGGVGPGMDKDT
eukprot:CAMPEP_0195074302 /NCGR_PEP_ID=MMETSP0448-20130528/17443_1 /TAXON_ID=66468 /ORGANISM="Heterocapsa triquestra, Strain CCMP 448" /LENGTH=544 /DNA_ID=CAMNT_0040106537 /DNA_START=77 /DNA_END=1709 /DNA_ORIENTATION=+